MGVLYHLRHPLLALDLMHEHVAGDLLRLPVDAARQREVVAVADDYPFAEQRHLRRPGYPQLYFVEHRYAGDSTNWWIPNRACAEAMLRSAGFKSSTTPRRKSTSAVRGGADRRCRLPPRRAEIVAMIEAVMFWNEPNNKSHWDFELDPGLDDFRAHGAARRPGDPAPRHRGLTRVLGGISPIDPNFISNMAAQGVLDEVDAVAVHGFPLDWNHWQIDEWPAKLAEIRAVTDAAGVGLRGRRLDLRRRGGAGVRACGAPPSCCAAAAPRIHWYSLYDLPQAWPATTRHREAEGSSYYRHFYMGLLREDGTPKRALRRFADYTPATRHLPVVPLRGPPARRRGRAG